MRKMRCSVQWRTASDPAIIDDAARRRIAIMTRTITAQELYAMLNEACAEDTYLALGANKGLADTVIDGPVDLEELADKVNEHFAKRAA
jgi:hypothetical protein